MLLIGFVRSNHIIEDGVGARLKARCQIDGFEVMSKTNRLWVVMARLLLDTSETST